MTGQLRQRPGDQPLPVPNDGPSMHDLLIEDLHWWTAPAEEKEAIKTLLLKRKQLGIERYGSILQAGNERDWRQDIAEELADAAVYARQGIEETRSDTDQADTVGELYDAIVKLLFWLQRIPGFVA